MIEDQLRRLADFGFQVASGEMRTHSMIERDGFVALVEHKGESLGKAGAPGFVSEHGFAVLVWRGDQAYFVAKGFEQPASAEQVDSIRRFARDLDAALQY